MVSFMCTLKHCKKKYLFQSQYDQSKQGLRKSRANIDFSILSLFPEVFLFAALTALKMLGAHFHNYNSSCLIWKDLQPNIASLQKHPKNKHLL